MKIKDILGEDGETTPGTVEAPPQNGQLKIKTASGEINADAGQVKTGPDGKPQITVPSVNAGDQINIVKSDQATAEETEDDPDLADNPHNHDVSNDGTDKFIDDVRDAASELAQGHGSEQHDHTHPEMEAEGFLGLGNKTPEEWAKTSKQMATLLQFQAKYQGTPYADQVAKRIALLKDRLDLESGEVAGQGGAPKPVVPPEQFDMKQLKEADDKLLEKMRAIAGLR